MRLLVTAIGRSGTKYMSQVLSKSGLPCTHEKVVPNWCITPAEFKDGTAESSWPAAGFIHYRRDLCPWANRRLLIYHQTRDPLLWMASWVDTVWRPNGGDNPTFDMLKRLTGHEWKSWQAGDPIGYAMVIYVRWNSMIEKHTKFRYRVEDVDEYLVSKMLKKMGKKVDMDRICEALVTTSKKANSRAKQSKFSWSKLPDKFYTERFVEMARRYGYG